MNPLVFAVAKDIFRVYADEKERARNPEYLPRPALILFQRFKKAYEGKYIQGLEDTISENFKGDIYGKTKSDFIAGMISNFNGLKYGLNPYLKIEVFNISVRIQVGD